jgi:arylsulfatase A-like enzyme
MEGDVLRSNQKQFRKLGFQNVKLVKQWTAIYYAMVAQVDETIGSLLDTLESQKLDNQTIGTCAHRY